MTRVYYLHVEISTLCNAACPCCPRFNQNSPLIGPGLQPGYITFDLFKKWFPPEILSATQYINFCGNHGDPGTNPDLPKIIEYLSQFNNIKKFQFHTNGGMKTHKFWKEVALACNKCEFPVNPVFSIDGLKDTNHIYRRNVKWDKLVDNLKGFLSVIDEKIWTTVDYLVFKHNEHQIEEAEKFFNDLGINDVQFKAPINLDDGESITPIPSLGTDGSVLYWIYPTDVAKFKPSYLAENAATKYPKKTLIDIEKSANAQTWDEKEYEEIENSSKSKIIPRCGYNDLYVEADGEVHQCCFVATGYYSIRELYMKGKNVGPAAKQLLDYKKKIGFEKFNLQHTTINEILDSKLLFKMYNANWNKTYEGGKMLHCVEFCGSKNSIDTVYEVNKEKDISSRTSNVPI